jgi:hypothetical protein
MHGNEKYIQKIWSEYLRVRDYLEELGVDGKIIVEWILGK